MKDKQKFFGIVLLVLMVLGLGYGIWKVHFAPEPVAPDPTPVEATDPAVDPDPVQEPEPITTDDPNAVPVTEPDPEPEPPQEQPAAQPAQSGSEGGNQEQPPADPWNGGIPGFDADEIIRHPKDSGGEQPNPSGSTLPEGVDPNGHTGSF